MFHIFAKIFTKINYLVMKKTALVTLFFIFSSFYLIAQEKVVINKMIEEIESSIIKKGKRDIKSDTIGTLVMYKLKKTDKISYIRFASVYKDFQDIESDIISIITNPSSWKLVTMTT